MSLFAPATVEQGCFPQYIQKGLILNYNVDDYEGYQESSIYYNQGIAFIGKELSKLKRYNSDTQYQVDDRVIYNNSWQSSLSGTRVYKCISPVINGSTPDEDTTHWTDVSSDYETDTVFGDTTTPRTIEFYISTRTVERYGPYFSPTYYSDGREYQGLIHCGDYYNPSDKSADFHMSLFYPIVEDDNHYNVFIRFPDGTEYSPLDTPFGYNNDTVIANSNIYERDFRLRPYGGSRYRDDPLVAEFVTISIVIDNFKTTFYVNGNKKFCTFNGVVPYNESREESYDPENPTDFIDIPPVLYWGAFLDDSLYPSEEYGITASGFDRNCISMRCYDRALSDAEIKQNALCDKNRDNPNYCIYWWC